jgi:hypothetical protein
MNIRLLADNILKLTSYTKGSFLFGLLLIFVGSVFIRGIHGFKDCMFLIPSLIGLIMVLCCSKTEIIFDKSRGIFIHRVKTIFNTKEKQYSLSIIDKIIIERIRRNQNNYRLIVLMKKGWSVPVTTNYTTESSYYSARRAAEKINEFLFSKQ